MSPGEDRATPMTRRISARTKDTTPGRDDEGAARPESLSGAPSPGAGGERRPESGGGGGRGDGGTTRRSPRSSSKKRRRSGGGGGGGGGGSDVDPLRRLLEACAAHRSRCHVPDDFRGGGPVVPGAGVSSAGGDDEAGGGGEEDPEVPEKCRKTIRSLRSVLIGLERRYRAPAPAAGREAEGEGERGESPLRSASEASRLAAFYRSALRGTFCPHSPGLFGYGRDGAEILPRVHQLLRLLSCRPVLAQAADPTSSSAAAAVSGKGGDAKSGGDDAAASSANRGKKPDGGGGGGGPPPRVAADDLADAVALLLDAVPEERLRRAAALDLIALLYDLSALSASGVLGDGTPAAGGAAPPLRISTFEGTREVRRRGRWGWSRRGGGPADDEGSDRDDGDGGNGWDDGPFEVEVPSVDALLSLRAGVFRALSALLSRRRQRRLGEMASEGVAAALGSPPPGAADGGGSGDGRAEEEEGTAAVAALAGDADRHLGADLDDDAGVRSALLASMREALLTPWAAPPTSADGSASGGGPDPRAALALRDRACAAELLGLLHEELLRGAGRGGGGRSRAFSEVSALVAGAVGAHARSLHGTATSGGRGGRDAEEGGRAPRRAAEEGLSSALSALLRDTVLFPPPSSSSPPGGASRPCPLLPSAGRGGDEDGRRSAALLDALLGCLPGLAAVATAPGRPEGRRLCRMALRAAHALLGPTGSSDSVPRARAPPAAMAAGVVPALLDLLVLDPSLSSAAAAVLLRLLLPDGPRAEGGRRGGTDPVAGACSLSWRARTRTRGASASGSAASAAAAGGGRGRGGASAPSDGSPLRPRDGRRRGDRGVSPPPSGNKRRKLTYLSSSQSPGAQSGRRGRAGLGQLQVETSPRRPLPGPQEDPDVVANRVLEPGELNGEAGEEDESPVASLAQLFDEALEAAEGLVSAATNAKNDDHKAAASSEGPKRLGGRKSDMAVLDTITAHSAAVIAGSLRLLLGHRARARRPRGELDSVINALLAAISHVADAISHGCCAGQAEEAGRGGMGAKRLKKLLGGVVGVGYCLHFSLGPDDSAEAKGPVPGDGEALTDAAVLLATSRCALSAWHRDSPLASESSKSPERLDPLDEPLERPYFQSQEGESGGGATLAAPPRRHCAGFCADLSSSVGLRASNAAPLHCLCRFLDRSGTPPGAKAERDAEGRLDQGWRTFRGECAQFLFDCSLPLQTRCLIFTCLHPVFSSPGSEGKETSDNSDCAVTGPQSDSTISAICHILHESSTVANSITSAALAGVPFLVRSLALWEGTEVFRRGDGSDTKVEKSTVHAKESNASHTSIRGQATAAYVTNLLEHHTLLNCIVRLTASVYIDSSSQQHHNPPAIQRLAYICLRLLLNVYSSALSAKADKDPHTGHMRLLETYRAPEDAFSLVLALSSGVAVGNQIEIIPLEETVEKSPDEMSAASVYDLFVARLPSVNNQEANHQSTSPHVRLAKWMFLAEACHRCSLSELRRWNVQKVFQPERVAQEVSSVNESGGEGVSGIDLGANTALWILSCPFLDPDRLLREYAARHLGSFLLGCKSKVLFALLLSDTKWKEWISDGGDIVDSDATVTKLFREIDRLLFKHCDVNQSLLSYTAAPTAESTAGTLSSLGVVSAADGALSHRATAVRALGSICESADLGTAAGVKIFEHALLRLIRMWVQPTSCDTVEAIGGVPPDLCALTYAELRRLDGCRPLFPILREVCLDTFVPALFSDILVPGGGADGNVERNYHFLMTFIHSFLSAGPSADLVGHLDMGHRHTGSINEMLDYVDAVYPVIFPALIIEEDYEALRMCAAFRLYLVGQYKELDKAGKRRDQSGRNEVVGQMKGKKKTGVPGVGTSTKKLNDHTKRLCNSPTIIEQVLPRLLLHPDRAPLVFFLRTVNNSEINLRQLLHAKGHSVLKALFWELSKAEHDVFNEESEDTRQIVQALKKGAILVDQEERMRSQSQPKDSSKPAELKRSHTLDAIDAMNTDASTSSGHDAAMNWVTSNFIMLHVNLVSQKWKMKSAVEKIRALRCLRAMLQFLQAEESPQFFTHVLSTVNQCLASTAAGPQMQFLAVQIIARYVQVLLTNEEAGIKTVGENLSSIVVSLFPVLDCQEGCTEDGKDGAGKGQCCTENYAARSLVHAVSFMETLVNGEVGDKLAGYFADIPFLPPNPELDGVKSSLRSMGVHFDNLLVITQIGTQNTQYGGTGRESLASTGSGLDNADKNENHRPQCSSQAQASLQKRLRVLAAMISHEQNRVRVVVLKHLADLLRANRSLFHRLVESEEAASMRFLTVVKEAQPHESDGANASAGLTIAGGGVVTSLVQSLLARCVVETDAEARLALAICLGECGAIDQNRLSGQVDSALSAALTTDSFEASGTHGAWRISQPPWNSQIMRYELQLVTKHLVVALKAAPTTLDQHKVAFTIQELLALLDESANRSAALNAKPTSDPGKRHESSTKEKMSPWLSETLSNAGVLEVVEPFWATSYHQSDKAAPKKPPFFQRCATYSNWLSQWCRYMIFRSKDNNRSRWRRFFHACRSAVRSISGIRVAEFLLPLLVLDNITFGDSSDERNTVQELLDALSFGTTGDKKMPKSERQKAVNAVFMVLDTLQIWNERETEARHRGARGGSSPYSDEPRQTPTDYPVDGLQSPWPAEDSIACIDDLVRAMPLSVCAAAAASVGMHARSLRLLEFQARSQFVSLYDDTHGEDRTCSEVTFGHQRKLCSIDLGLAQHVLGCLSDFDTMSAVAQERRSRVLTDQINERELLKDWSGALQGYEQALQIEQRGKAESKARTATHDIQVLERGMVNSLLELGQLESVLIQVKGLLQGYHPEESRSKQATKHLLPSAVEAAWRLGDWGTLEQLVDDAKDECDGFDADGLYHLSLGRAMLGLHNQMLEQTLPSIVEARKAVLASLAGAARESYTRAYPYLLRLHCLREIEDAAEVLCHGNHNQRAQNFADLVFSDAPNGWEWEGRLQMTASEVAGSNAIVNSRLSLSYIAGLPGLEGSLWLGVGKKARKYGLYNIAENFLAHASAACDRLEDGNPDQVDPWKRSCSLKGDVTMQLAKLKHATGKTGAALRLLDQDIVHGLLNKEGEDLKKLVNELFRDAKKVGNSNRDEDMSNYAECLAKEVLQGTEWLVEGGLKSGPEIVSRYNLVNSLRTLGGESWERSHFLFARYLDSLLEARILALSGYLGKKKQIVDEDALRETMFKEDETCQRYVLQSIREYGKALQLGQKHVFRALPRLLTLWFDFTQIIITPEADVKEKAKKGGKEAKKDTTDAISALADRQTEANAEMVKFVKSIPAISFYAASLPQLISRVSHTNTDTARIVRAILAQVLERFPRQAMWSMAWLRESVESARAKIGEEIFKSAAKSLRRKEDMKMHDLLVASKALCKFLLLLAKHQPKGKKNPFYVRPWKGEVELSEFVPPVQAALSISPGSAGLTNSHAFPAFVPRMRCFSTSVLMMSSKARPKKVTVYAIPAGQKPMGEKGKSHAGDIGEMHFLVKQEARGDLRKDARVQDLNNVINRLLAAGGSSSKAQRQQRRLHLRTFSVVCLSEDCGILEWVPNTDSFRNLVAGAYNPQAHPHSLRRRGKRIGNFGDVALRTSFEKCQNMYFKNGQLTRGGELFGELLKQYPPVMYWWFVRKFPDPHFWFEARTAFTLSAAAWSAVGHVIGLGDRHSENILVDTKTGDCVHVDFDCIFDKGLQLPRPEVVPFRLTPNILDAFGPVGAEGAFTGGLTAAMGTLRDNRDTLLSVLEPFLKDPVIDWKRHRVQQNKGKQAVLISEESKEAERSIKVIDGRLRGVYNLRNPNLKKYPRTDTTEQEDETSNIIPLSVEGQVQKMISEASSHENLVQLYVGWMPWL